MRVYRKHYVDRNGKKQQAQKWYIDFVDHLDRRQRWAGLTDKRQTEALAKQIERLVSCRVAGERPDASLMRWLETIPQQLRKKLVKAGLVDSNQAAASKPLKRHIEDWEASLLAKGNTPDYVDIVVGRARRIIEGCRFYYWSDVSASKVQNYLSSLRADGDGISAQTFNFYLQAIKQFGKWMVADQRATTSPVEYLKGLNVRTDRRHDRRALEPDEVRRLLETTKAGPTRFNMSGEERALLYRTAAETGLRRKELGTLTPASFDFENRTVTVQAGYSKRRRHDVLPLRKETAALLQRFVAAKMPNVPVFKMPYKTADMLKADLADAGIPYVDSAGHHADFHALRHSCGSMLAAAGVHPKVAQSLMRHSSIDLTMSRYSHVFRGQEADAVEKLPDLSLPSVEQQAACATGTDCGATSGAKHCRIRGTAADQQGTTTRTGARKTAISKANGRIRTDNHWFTKPELYR